MFHSAREQHESGNPIKLEVYQCIALRTVVIWVGWSVEEDWAERQTTPLADSIGSLLEVFFNLPIVKASPKGKQKSGLAPGRLLPHQRLLPGEEPTAYMARIGMRGKVPELHLLNFGPYTIDEITLMILLADTDDEGLDGICEEMFLGLSLAAAHAR